MSVTTRTNLATNPAAASTTGWGNIAGTGGAASLSNQTGTGAFGAAFNRSTYTVATTAPSGAITYLQTGLAAGTAYAFQMWVRSSIAQTVNLTASFQTSSTTINTVVGANVVLAANTWTELSVTGVSGAGVDRVNLVASVASTGSNWANGSTFDGDAVVIETGSTAGPYFDGTFTAAASVVYAWTGTANASTSTAKTYIPALTLAAYTDFSPCPRTGITVADLAPSNCTINLWRTADGERTSVRSARGITVVGSTFITDYETPLGRNVQYDLEIVSGVSTGVVAPSQTVILNTDTGCIQDPLVPNTAVPVHGEANAFGEAFIRGTALKALEYNAGVSVIPILGSAKPVAILGPRQAASNVDFSLVTNAAEQNTALRALLKETPLLLVRGLPEWGDYLPGLMYTANAKTVEQPFDVAWGGYRTRWEIVGDSVSSPRLNVLVPIWTYGDVQNLWSTYQQAQDTFAAKAYLDALKSPTGV